MSPKYGPRPLTSNHFDHYPHDQRKVIGSVRPGLSGVGSIVFRDEERLLSDKEDPKNYYRTEIAPYKALFKVGLCDKMFGLLLIDLLDYLVINPSSNLSSGVKDLFAPRATEVRLRRFELADDHSENCCDLK